MAGIATGQGSNKLDTELNLVPFIDLLSTLVLFLLISAVWMQVSAIQASVSSKGKSSTSAVEQSKILVHLTQAGLQITWPSGMPGYPGMLARTKAGYDYPRLAALVKKAIATSKPPLLAVSADDNIDYGFVIEAIDSVKTATGQAVALSTN